MKAFVNQHDKFYILSSDEELQLCICVPTHCDVEGHSGVTATLLATKNSIGRPKMETDVQVFVGSCPVCVLSATAAPAPCQLGLQRHAENVKELITFDFLFNREARDGPK